MFFPDELSPIIRELKYIVDCGDTLTTDMLEELVYKLEIIESQAINVEEDYDAY